MHGQLLQMHRTSNSRVGFVGAGVLHMLVGGVVLQAGSMLGVCDTVTSVLIQLWQAFGGAMLGVAGVTVHRAVGASETCWFDMTLRFGTSNLQSI